MWCASVSTVQPQSQFQQEAPSTWLQQAWLSDWSRSSIMASYECWVRLQGTIRATMADKTLSTPQRSERSFHACPGAGRTAESWWPAGPLAPLLHCAGALSCRPFRDTRGKCDSCGHVASKAKHSKSSAFSTVQRSEPSRQWALCSINQPLRFIIIKPELLCSWLIRNLKYTQFRFLLSTYIMYLRWMCVP